MYYNRKKFIVKNIIFISFILLLATFTTHHIYYKFKNERNIDYSSESLDIVFHEESGNKVTLERPVPVTDAVGLSSKAYTLSIKNNLTEKVEYKIKLIDDTKIIEDSNEQIIPKELIKVAIKSPKQKTKIYSLDELEDNLLLSETINALDSMDYTIRVWVTSRDDIPLVKESSYHGLIKVIEQ